MSTIHTTGVWGSWSGGQTVTTEPASGPQADVTLVDRTDREAVADHKAGIAPTAVSLRAAYLRACRATELAEDDETADSTDPLDYAKEEGR